MNFSFKFYFTRLLFLLQRFPFDFDFSFSNTKEESYSRTIFSFSNSHKLIFSVSITVVYYGEIYNRETTDNQARKTAMIPVKFISGLFLCFNTNKSFRWFSLHHLKFQGIKAVNKKKWKNVKRYFVFCLFFILLFDVELQRG